MWLSDRQDGHGSHDSRCLHGQRESKYTMTLPSPGDALLRRRSMLRPMLSALTTASIGKNAGTCAAFTAYLFLSGDQKGSVELELIFIDEENARLCFTYQRESVSPNSSSGV